MCILITTRHIPCGHKLRSATSCGSKSLACLSTFESRTGYYACPDCQFNIALSTQEPVMGCDDLEITRARREEAEIPERTSPAYLADRRASASFLSSVGSTVSTPSAFADTVLVSPDRCPSTLSLSTLGSAVNTRSTFAGPTPEPESRRPNARKRPRARDATPEESSDSSYDNDDPPPASCTRHASLPSSYQSSQCLKPADVPEDIMRKHMKSMPTWKEWVPSSKAPAGGFQRLPKSDRRGTPTVDSMDAPATRGRAVKRRKTTGGKGPRGN